MTATVLIDLRRRRRLQMANRANLSASHSGFHASRVDLDICGLAYAFRRGSLPSGKLRLRTGAPAGTYIWLALLETSISARIARMATEKAPAFLSYARENS